MKKLIIVLIIIFAGGRFIDAQELESSLLWRISGDGISSPSYLYGTFHMLCPDDLELSDKVINAMGESERLVLELDFDDPAMMMEVQQSMMFRDGTTAKDYLTEEEYQKVSDFFINKMNLPFSALASIKPFFLSSMTVLYYLECQPVSVEEKLVGLATEQGMEVYGLETVAEQLGFIDSIPLEDAASMLVLSIEDDGEMNEMTDEMVATYLSEDLEGLQLIMDEYMEDEYIDINDHLLENRNHDWVPKIIALAKEQPSFIAFGTGHLPGEEGVIILLREAGYEVEPVF